MDNLLIALPAQFVQYKIFFLHFIQYFQVTFSNYSQKLASIAFVQSPSFILSYFHTAV